MLLLPGRAGGSVLVVVLAVVLTSGCSTALPGGDRAGGDEVVEPVEVPVEDGQDPQDGGTEEQGPLPEEETSTTEAPAAGGDDRVSIELAGLPVGGGEVLAVDGTWCQVLFWGSVPADVWLDIESVRVRDEGATLLESGCEESPPCAGARISADGPVGCAVMVRPPSPDVAFVEVQLNGTLSCPDQPSCDALGATDGSWTRITNPAAADGSGPSGEPSGEPSAGDVAGTG